MSNTYHKVIARSRILLGLAAYFMLFYRASPSSACEEDVCIDLDHLWGETQFYIPPNRIDYVLELPDEPGVEVKVYVYLMRAKANGQFEIASTSDVKTMKAIEQYTRWDPRRTPADRKRGEKFVLAATLNPRDRNPRAITRVFEIKWR